MQPATPSPSVTTLSSKGQLVIPKSFRDAAGLEIGSQIVIEYKTDGSLSLKPASHSISTIFGLGKANRNSGLTDDEAILKAASAEDKATKSRKS